MPAAVSCPFIHRQDVATRQVTAHLCPASICWRKVPLSQPQIQISRLLSLDQTPTIGPINRGLQGQLYNLLDLRRNENRGPLIQKAGKMPFRVHIEVLPLFCGCHSTFCFLFTVILNKERSTCETISMNFTIRSLYHTMAVLNVSEHLTQMQNH